MFAYGESYFKYLYKIFSRNKGFFGEPFLVKRSTSGSRVFRKAGKRCLDILRFTNRN